MFFVCLYAGVCKTEEDEGPSTEEDSQPLHGDGVCKWFNVRMGFGFLSMTNREGVPLDEPVDVFVHQVGLETEAPQRHSHLHLLCRVYAGARSPHLFALLINRFGACSYIFFIHIYFRDDH